MFVLVKVGWRSLLIFFRDYSFEAVLREGRERNSCSDCGVVFFMEKEGVQLLVFQKWFSCIMIEMRDCVKVAEKYSDADSNK